MVKRMVISMLIQFQMCFMYVPVLDSIRLSMPVFLTFVFLHPVCESQVGKFFCIFSKPIFVSCACAIFNPVCTYVYICVRMRIRSCMRMRKIYLVGFQFIS